MADQPYYSVFTKKGLELLTEAIRNGTKLGITHMAFGDGGGSLPIPNESFTKLVNEVHRTQLNSLAPDPNNANWLRAEAVIASAIGGFNIRELGLYAGDVLVAYSNYPSTYKPNPSDGTARIMTFRMVLQIDNTASFELKIDADIVLATIASVKDAKQELYENTATVINTITDLIKLEAWNGRTIYVKSFYEPDYNRATPYLGGAYYIYNSASISQSDGLFNRNGWILQFDSTVNIYQLGFKGDAITDETTLLKSVVSAIKSNVKNSNKNKIILDGSLSYVMLSDNVTIDLCYVGLRNIRFKALDAFKPKSYTSLITYITTDSWSDVPITARKDFRVVHDNVDIICSDARDYSIGLITAPNAVVPMADADIAGLTILGFKYGLAFDENSYLLTFSNPRIMGQYCSLTTTFSLGINTNEQKNMGENIRAMGGTIANSKKVFEMLKGNGIGMHFFGTSLDYNGGNERTGFETWFDFKAGTSEFSFFGCHWEAGNENAGLRRMFHLGYRTKISIFGGEMLFTLKGGYNSCEYFCYNDELGQMSIEGTRIFAPAVKYWVNKGLSKFTPMFNSPDNAEIFITSDYTKSLALDPNIKDLGVSDIFVATGYTDNPLESSQVKITRGTVKINGSETNAIQIYKKNGIGFVDSFDIYIPRRSDSTCISSCAMKVFMTDGSSKSNEVSYTLSLVKSRQLNSQGIPIEIASAVFTKSSWLIDTGATFKEVYVTNLRTGDTYKSYNYYKLSCRLFNFQSQGTLNIIGLGFEETD